jgi:hypothetical protein
MFEKFFHQVLLKKSNIVKTFVATESESKFWSQIKAVLLILILIQTKLGK